VLPGQEAFNRARTAAVKGIRRIADQRDAACDQMEKIPALTAD
jgi:hypothetical protein